MRWDRRQADESEVRFSRARSRQITALRFYSTEYRLRQRAPASSAFTPFVISSGFVAGENTMDFIVNNGGSSRNPTGLRVDLSGTAQPQEAR